MDFSRNYDQWGDEHSRQHDQHIAQLSADANAVLAAIVQHVAANRAAAAIVDVDAMLSEAIGEQSKAHCELELARAELGKLNDHVKSVLARAPSPSEQGARAKRLRHAADLVEAREPEAEAATKVRKKANRATWVDACVANLGAFRSRLANVRPPAAETLREFPFVLKEGIEQ